ncbi:uncharacterized protein LOC128711187 [Anopheles marshallii]|uniref:uncharacterized protein LOC128711187 n=1 Tax=Anopheles marshallii TaxID=1521116 RepID=UPI00237A851F|nr:uncharacterized protein LOC128711187 [Anopheles marshallii]
MKSSMAITKSAAFRFMLLLHLFLKVKMCVGFVDALAAGDSDINYEDSDERLVEAVGGGGAARGREGTAWVTGRFVPTTSVPAPSNLMRWEGTGHTARSRMHHVRHEQHYLKHRPIKVPNAVDSTMVAQNPVPHQAHTGPGTASVQQNAIQYSQHHHHHHHHHNHHNRPKHHVQVHPSKHDRKVDADSTEQEVILVEPNRQGGAHRVASQSAERRAMYERANAKNIWNSMSEGREVRDRQVVINRKRSASAFHLLTSNALTDAEPSSSKKSSERSINPGSKNYFEELLNNYKSNSPYYKELHQVRSPQTKALPPGKRNQRSSAEAATKSVSKSKAPPAIDGDLDYLYDDETDDSVQNDAPSGGAMSTSTRAPSTTTTTVRTTTTASTTTARSIPASDESDETGANESNDGAGSEADTSYSTYYQKAYAMHSNPRRNGNNRYNSIARPPTPVQHHQQQPHYKRVHTDRIDPAKQVSYPGRYETLTDYKQANFGSKDAVQRSYNAYSNIHVARSEAKKHIDRITTEGKCQVPKPKIIPASNDRSKVFTPHCTILHRCEADTGCCAPTQTCAPKNTSEVKLFFYVSNATYVSNIGPRQQSTITTLTFTNHTECHCVLLDSVQNSLENSAEGSGGSSGGVSSISSSCTCPHHYKPVFDNESQCYCDCLSSDRDCIRFKEGFENFSMETRKCIRSKKCNVPRCEYGMYNRHEGRCPKKIDRFNEQFPQYR